MIGTLRVAAGIVFLAGLAASAAGPGSQPSKEGRRLFDQETFGGNGRTCRTCHTEDTGTVSPGDAAKRLKLDPNDPLFLHDGSDDGLGNGVTRMLADATILVTIPLPSNVRLADDPLATSITVRRGIPTTLNTPALDNDPITGTLVFQLDGRQPSLESQAAGAIEGHAQGAVPSAAALHQIAEFQRTNSFFSSSALRDFFHGGPAPGLPEGRSPSEKRGRRFFEDVPPNPTDGFTSGLCSHCHSGPLLNQTNQFAKDFIGLPISAGARFISVGVAEFNTANNPIREFIFNGGTPNETRVVSPDPGRALITGIGFDAPPAQILQNVNAFKISQLRGIRRTAPYFHDNSAKTLEDVAAHYARFFSFVTGGAIVLTAQDQADIVAFLTLLD
jgi:cytochrome c peroxidase